MIERTVHLYEAETSLMNALSHVDTTDHLSVDLDDVVRSPLGCVPPFWQYPPSVG